MRYFTFILIFTLLSTSAFSQNRFTKQKAALFGKSSSKRQVDEPKALKGEGDVFFYESFNWADPNSSSGWSLPDGWQIKDENDFGHFWLWRAGNDSIKGKYTFEPGHIHSRSPEDGYLVLPMDEYNHADGVDTDNEGTAWFQLPSVDCSGKVSVILKARQNFRACCGDPNIQCMISSDLGVHWASFSMSFGTGTNVYCQTPNVELNISEVAAGSPEVWIRFAWMGNSHYFWCIDDIELSEGYTNELQLEDQWLYNVDLEDDGDEGFVYLLPLSQIGQDNFGGYHFAGGLLNSGIDEQYDCKLNVEIFKNGNSVYNETSESASIWPLDRDTMHVETPYVPDGYGDYKIVMTALQEQEDGVLSNNVYTDTFYVNDSIFSYSDFTDETHVSTAGWVDGNNDGDACGIAVDIKEECEANSISVFIKQRPENPQASTQPGMGFMYWIYFYDEETQGYYELIPSEFMEVEEEMINTWVTLPLEKDGESEFLIPGYYIAGIQTWHNGGPGADNNEFRFTIGADQDHEYNAGKTVGNMGVEGEWAVLPEMAMVMLNLNNSGAPSSMDVVFNVDMSLPIAESIFNPDIDYVDVAGTFNGWDGALHHLSDDDGDGIYSLTVPGFVPWGNIEYKYRINGNWDTSEFPFGGPNREHRITFHNALDDIFNDGLSTVGINPDDFVESIGVYPNPSDGVFRIVIKNARHADINISVMDIQGKEVYKSRANSVVEYSENIDLQNKGKGLYFLRINDKITKIVVQ